MSSLQECKGVPLCICTGLGVFLSLSSLATGEEEGEKIEDTLTELSKQLRGLKGLPLAITSVQGACPEFRHCSVFPPLPWRGRTPRRMLAEPSPENQSDCLYPSCDSSATPPFVPALEGIVVSDVCVYFERADVVGLMG